MLMEKKQKCKRKIVWFNPPYSMGVKSNVGETFFETFTETFSSNTCILKLFNKDTVKISYGCMKNIGYIIASHNFFIPPPKQIMDVTAEIKLIVH